MDSLASVLHLKQARPSSYRQASERTLGRQDLELQCSRPLSCSLTAEGECIFMCWCQDQEVEEWRLGASLEGLGASMVAVVRSEACL